MSKLTVNELMPDLFRTNQPSGLVDSAGRSISAKTEAEHERDELDLVSMIDDILRGNNRVPPDLRIDDRDLPEFPNFYTFCFSKKGMDQAPFARQLAIATHLLAEWCPKCTRPAFADIHRIPVDYPAKDFPDKVTFLEHGVCPRCGSTRSEMLAEGVLNVYSELVGCAGQRSGKSALLGLLGPYIIHKWLKLQKPVEVLGLMKNSILVGTFVGLTWQKAIELLWQPVHNAITDSPWFQEYHRLLDHYGERYDTELYKFKDTLLHYNHRNLFIAPSGPNKRTLRGATRFLSVIDELGWFPHGEENDNKERASANEVYISLDRSLKTVRKSAMRLLESGYDNVPMAYNCSISSPSSYMDKIMSLLRAHSGSSDVYTYHLPTWEMNPLFKKSDFSKEYRDNPVKAERDFGANPPMSENPWFSDLDVIAGAMTGKSNRVRYRYSHITNNSGHRQRFAKVIETQAPNPCPRTIMSIDAGYANNSLAVAISHPTTADCENARVLAVVEVAPVRGQNVLNYTHIARALFAPLIEAFNVGLVAADRWQSIKILQDLEQEHGVATATYSLTADDFTYIYDCFMDDERQIIELPRLEMSPDEIASVELENYPHCFKYMPVSHLYHQFMTATTTPRGVVDKGQGYTDDLLRAVCLGLSYCFDEDAVREHNLFGAAAARSSGFVGTRTGKAVNSSSIGARGFGAGGTASGRSSGSIGSRG